MAAEATKRLARSVFKTKFFILGETRMERALSSRENRWKFALEGAGYGLWDWNAKTNEAHFSRQWKEMLGFEEHEIGNNLEEWRSRVHPEDVARVNFKLELYLTGETGAYVSEHRVMHKDGQYRWILDRGKIVSRDSEGNPLRIIGTRVDITETRKAGEKLRESEEKYRILVEESQDPIFSFSPDGKYASVNRAFAEGVGLPIEGIIGKTFWEVFPKEEADKRHAAFSEVLETGKIKLIESCVPRPDGDRYYMSTLVPVKGGNGQIISVICSSKDITERKISEDALLRNRDFISMILNNIPLAVYTKDLHTSKYLTINNAIEKQFGIPVDSVVGKTTQEIFKDVAPEVLGQIAISEKEAVSTGKVVKSEQELLLGDGQTKFIKSLHLAIYDKDGAPEYLLGISEDITAMKMMEIEIASKRAALAQISTAQAVSALVAGMNHDINNALSAITGGYEITQMNTAKIASLLTRMKTEHAELSSAINNSRVREAISALSKSGNGDAFSKLEVFLEESFPKHLSDIESSMAKNNKYLTYIEHGSLIIKDLTAGIGDYVKGDQSLGNIDLRRAVLGSVSVSKGQYKPMAQDHGKTVAVEVCESSPPATVFGNTGEFMGVIVNLVSNAVAEFNTGGNNYIRISWEKGRNSELEDVILVRVSNDGPQISEHMLSKLFSEKVESTHAGSGIGLLAVRSTLNRFGARIRHVSDFKPLEKDGSPASAITAAKGWTTFEMELRVSDETQGIEMSRIKAPPVSRSILVVDDEPYMLNITEEYAKNLGHRAIVFEKPEEALAYYAEHLGEIDVVLSDQCMPGMNGCQLISKMKALDSNKTFMLMTGHGGITLAREDTKDVHLLVRKPFDQGKMDLAIEKAVGSSNAGAKGGPSPEN